MKTKIIIAGILFSLGAIAIVASGPVLAHPFWGVDGDEAYSHMWGWGENFTMPHWRYNGNYTGPWGNGTMPYSDGDEYYCPGPYWADPDSNQTVPFYPPEDAPQRGYGCGRWGGKGVMMGRGSFQPRAPTGWSG